MKKLLFLFISILLILFSCKNTTTNSQDENTVIRLDLVKKISKYTRINYSDLFSKVDGYQLDTTHRSQIGLVSKITVFNNQIYVLDDFYAKKLMVFNLENGKHLFSIGTKGKGPGEFLFISDFEIDKNTGNIILSDEAGQKIVFFDKKGTFIEERKVPFYPVHFAKKENFFYFLINPLGKNKNFLVITDDKFHILKEYFNVNNYPKNENFRWQTTPFYSYNTQLCLTFPYCDTIFKISGQDLDPYIEFNTGEFASLKKVKEMNVSNGFSGFQKFQDQCIGSYHYFENDSFIDISYSKFDKFYKIFLRKNDRVHSTGSVLINNLIPTCSDPTLFDSRKGTIFCLSNLEVRNPEQFKYHEKCKYSERFVSTLKNYDANSNPLIVIMK